MSCSPFRLELWPSGVQYENAFLQHDFAYPDLGLFASIKHNSAQQFAGGEMLHCTTVPVYTSPTGKVSYLGHSMGHHGDELPPPTTLAWGGGSSTDTVT